VQLCVCVDCLFVLVLQLCDLKLYSFKLENGVKVLLFLGSYLIFEIVVLLHQALYSLLEALRQLFRLLEEEISLIVAHTFLDA
jgi:hypothetical protein